MFRLQRLQQFRDPQGLWQQGLNDGSSSVSSNLQACQACVFTCIQCLPVTPGWNLSACVTVRHEAAFRQRALTTECRGRGSTCKGNTQLPVDAAHEASQAAVPYSLAARGAPTSNLSTARAGLQPSICNKNTLHLQIPCGHKQTCSKMHTDATSKGQRVTPECVWL